MVSSLFDSLNALQNLTETDVILSGLWTFPNQVHRIWHGEAAAEIPIVGISFLKLGERIFWHKSNHGSNTLAIRLVLQPLLVPHEYQFICYLGSYNANHDTRAALNDSDDLPEIPHSRLRKTGHLFSVATFESTPTVEMFMLILAKQDVKIARGHIWGLKKSFRVALTPPLLDVFSHGRKGEFSL